MGHGRVIRLSDPPRGKTFRFLGDRVDARSLAEGRRSVVTVTRTGHFHDPRYGEFDITHEMLLSMVRNFEADVFGQRIVLDKAHQPQLGAAGFVDRLFLDGNKLRAEIEWTPLGVKAVSEEGFIYVSAEFADDFIDNEQRKAHGPTLLGAGLTPRPVIKRLDPVQLAEGTLDGVPTLVSDRITRILTEETQTMLKNLLQALRKKLGEAKLPETLIIQLCAAFEQAAEGIADEARAKLLMEQFGATGTDLAKQLAETGAQAGTIQLSVQAPGGLTAEDVKKLLAEQQAADTAAAKKLAETCDANVALYRKALEDAKLEGLTDAQRKSLASAEELITAEMSEDQVKRLAAQQITLGNELAAAVKLTALGFAGPTGNVRISVDETNNIKQLQETVDRRTGLLDLPDSRRYAATGGVLFDVNKRFVEKVLAEFDRQHAAELAAEHKRLAAGDGVTGDVSVPVAWERTVIREALYGLVGMQFVDVGTIAFGTSASIPYSYRDTTAAGRGNTRVYQGGAIPRAGVIQTADTAYPIPQKLAFEVSDELRYLTAAGHINWDAVAENTQNASRIIREDTEQVLCNELLHASDEYGAVAVSNEDLELQADGSDRVFVLAQWPVVRPRKVYDLQGNQVGSTVNPVTVTYNSVALSEYDGTGTQDAGTYYVLDYNLGEIYLVDEAGAVQTPADATTYTISYSYATNTYKFDTDPGSVAVDAHWDTFLYRYGLRKATIEDERFHMANYGLMSGTVMTQIEQAKQFGANSKRPGTDLAADGNLGRVKDVPNFKTAAPGLWAGDQRLILGERGIARFRMMRPWQMGELQDQKDANGRFTGKKEAYGDQFVVLHTPTQLKRAVTSMVLYSTTARVARVNP